MDGHLNADREFEERVKDLSDPDTLRAYKEKYDGYRPSLLPRLCGTFLVSMGNLVYGYTPSYLKFRAVEVIARVPYHSWVSVEYTLLTLFYTNARRAMLLSKTAQFARIAQDNETMHVIVISELAEGEGRAGFIRYTLIPMLFAFVYFWLSYVLYLLTPRYSYELNYLFESHAHEQYSLFLAREGEALKQKTVTSHFLSWYGRFPEHQYAFFESVCIDELIHRNQSIEHLEHLRAIHS